MVVQLPTWAVVQRLILALISVAMVLLSLSAAVVPDMISCVLFTLMLLTEVLLPLLTTMVAVVAVALADKLTWV